MPSNILNKPEIPEKEINLDTDIDYDERRKDLVILPKRLTPKLAEFLGENPDDAKMIIGKVSLAVKARKAAKRDLE